MDQALMTPDVTRWLYGLVAGMTITVGHPEARAQATMAWAALDQLQTIIDLQETTHGAA